MDAISFNPAWLIAIGSLSSAVIGCVSIYLAWRSHQEVVSRKRPRVRLTVVSDPVRRLSLQIVIENVGDETAFDIVLQSPVPIPRDNLKPEDGEDASEFKMGPFANGIPALASGDRRVVNWGHWDGLRGAMKVLERDFIPVQACFTDARRKPYKDNSILEIDSFSCSRPDGDPLQSIASELRSIHSTLRSPSNPIYQPKVK